MMSIDIENNEEELPFNDPYAVLDRMKDAVNERKPELNKLKGKEGPVAERLIEAWEAVIVLQESTGKLNRLAESEQYADIVKDTPPMNDDEEFGDYLTRLTPVQQEIASLKAEQGIALVSLKNKLSRAMGTLEVSN